MNLRHAYRFLLRTPGFALFAILELALGIGLTTTAFFVVNAVLLRPLDLPEPNQLVEILSTNKKTGKTPNTAPGLGFREDRESRGRAPCYGSCRSSCWWKGSQPTGLARGDRGA